MKISEKGLDLVRSFEGLYLNAYYCPAHVLTIGYGHTGFVDGKAIKLGMTITKQKADELLAQDMARFEKVVDAYLPIYNFNQNEYDAMVSFAFNVGSIKQLTANGTRSKEVIAEKILLYNKAGGATLAGLTRRRKAERELFLTPVGKTDVVVKKEEPKVEKVEIIEEVDDEVIEKSKLVVDGKTYNVSRIFKDGTNFVKIRDVAKALNADVSSNGDIPELKTKTTEESKMIINGNEVNVLRILKDGTNYVKVRDIANALGMEISADGNIAILKDKEVTE